MDIMLLLNTRYQPYFISVEKKTFIEFSFQQFNIILLNDINKKITTFHANRI